MVTASGSTLRGDPFTRQQFLTGAVFHGGDDPLPTGGPSAGERLCCLVKTLIRDPGVERLLKERGIDPGRLLQSVEECCASHGPSEPTPGAATIATSVFQGSTATIADLLASDERVRSVLSEVLRTAGGMP